MFAENIYFRTSEQAHEDEKPEYNGATRTGIARGMLGALAFAPVAGLLAGGKDSLACWFASILLTGAATMVLSATKDKPASDRCERSKMRNGKLIGVALTALLTLAAYQHYAQGSQTPNHPEQSSATLTLD